MLGKSKYFSNKKVGCLLVSPGKHGTVLVYCKNAIMKSSLPSRHIAWRQTFIQTLLISLVFIIHSLSFLETQKEIACIRSIALKCATYHSGVVYSGSCKVNWTPDHKFNKVAQKKIVINEHCTSYFFLLYINIVVRPSWRTECKWWE